MFNIPSDWYVKHKGVDMNAVFLAYSLLGLAIISEVVGSTFLVKSEGFSKLFPSIMVIILFSLAFYLLSHVIKTIPLGIAYAIWAGFGIVLTAIVGYVLFKQTLDAPAMIGIALIVSGVVVINLFSQSTGH
jgi:small multidrug resistance pump